MAKKKQATTKRNAKRPAKKKTKTKPSNATGKAAPKKPPRPKFEDLIEACEKGELAKVQACIAARVSVKRKDEYGFTPLQRAVTNQFSPLRTKLAIMKCLIDAGSDLEAKSKDGRTALYLAAEFSRKKAPLEMLVEAGAKADVSSKHPVHIFTNSATPAIRKYLESVIGRKADWSQPTISEIGTSKKTTKSLTDAQWRKARRQIDQVFKALESEGLVALRNAGTTQEDGFADCSQIVHDRGGIKKSGIIGFCYYSSQDSRRAKKEGELWLSFWGAPKGTDSSMVKVGNLIRQKFNDAGFKVNWNGQPKNRPTVVL